jgi:GNAT superfamily N-acetyltransferase
MRYYQTGTLLALDEGDGTPIGIVLVTDEPGGGQARTVELKAVAVAEPHQGRGVGRRMLAEALQWLGARGVRRVVVGTASAGVGQLAFYQKAGFRLERVERDYFNPSRGYADDATENGIPLRDMVWMDQQLPPPQGGEGGA